MINRDKIPAELVPILEANLDGEADKYSFPPPVFEAMGGELIEISMEERFLTCRFPVDTSYLNPYGTMQGGMIAAAIDNTIGPLSMLVAKPNFTRHLELKYGKPITPELDYIYVTARFVEQKKRLLYFEAAVANEQGDKLVTAKATHWVFG